MDDNDDPQGVDPARTAIRLLARRAGLPDDAAAREVVHHYLAVAHAAAIRAKGCLDPEEIDACGRIVDGARFSDLLSPELAALRRVVVRASAREAQVSAAAARSALQGPDWPAVVRELLDTAEATIPRDAAERDNLSDPERYQAACPWCGAATNAATKEPHDDECPGERARALLRQSPLGVPQESDSEVSADYGGGYRQAVLDACAGADLEHLATWSGLPERHGWSDITREAAVASGGREFPWLTGWDEQGPILGTRAASARDERDDSPWRAWAMGILEPDSIDGEPDDDFLRGWIAARLKSAEDERDALEAQLEDGAPASHPRGGQELPPWCRVERVPSDTVSPPGFRAWNERLNEQVAYGRTFDEAEWLAIDEMRRQAAAWGLTATSAPHGAGHVHPFIAAIAAYVADHYRATAADELARLDITIPDSFVHEDVLDALQRMVSAQRDSVKCYYCDQPIEPNPVGRAEIAAHAAVCPEHPMRALEQEVASLKARLEETEAARPDDALAAYAQGHNTGLSLGYNCAAGYVESFLAPDAVNLRRRHDIIALIAKDLRDFAGDGATPEPAVKAARYRRAMEAGAGGEQSDPGDEQDSEPPDDTTHCGLSGQGRLWCYCKACRAWREERREADRLRGEPAPQPLSHAELPDHTEARDPRDITAEDDALLAGLAEHVADTEDSGDLSGYWIDQEENDHGSIVCDWGIVLGDRRVYVQTDGSESEARQAIAAHRDAVLTGDREQRRREMNDLAPPDDCWPDEQPLEGSEEVDDAG